MAGYDIMTIFVRQRVLEAKELQKILSEHAYIIKVRLGLHNLEDKDDDTALMILQLSGTPNQITRFEADLSRLEWVTAQHRNISN